MVTRSLVSYDVATLRSLWMTQDWMVTRSLVSYDNLKASENFFNYIEWSLDHWWVTTLSYHLPDKQNEIEWSPDHWWVTTEPIMYMQIKVNWMVTRSLVSYDSFIASCGLLVPQIEWSPDHWWVTTNSWSTTAFSRRIYCRHHQQRHLFSNYLSTSYSCTIKWIFQFQC